MADIRVYEVARSLAATLGIESICYECEIPLEVYRRLKAIDDGEPDDVRKFRRKEKCKEFSLLSVKLGMATLPKKNLFAMLQSLVKQFGMELKTNHSRGGKRPRGGPQHPRRVVNVRLEHDTKCPRGVEGNAVFYVSAIEI